MKTTVLALILSCLTTVFLLSGCVTTNANNSPNPTHMNPSGTPSPLNTSANPWTNVNPQDQAQQQAARVVQSAH